MKRSDFNTHYPPERNPTELPANRCPAKDTDEPGLQGSWDPSGDPRLRRNDYSEHQGIRCSFFGQKGSRKRVDQVSKLAGRCKKIGTNGSHVRGR